MSQIETVHNRNNDNNNNYYYCYKYNNNNFTSQVCILNIGNVPFEGFYYWNL